MSEQFIVEKVMARDVRAGRRFWNGREWEMILSEPMFFEQITTGKTLVRLELENSIAATVSFSPDEPFLLLKRSMGDENTDCRTQRMDVECEEWMLIELEDHSWQVWGEEKPTPLNLGARVVVDRERLIEAERERDEAQSPNRCSRLLADLAAEGSARCCYAPGCMSPEAWITSRCDCKYVVGPRTGEETGCCEMRAAYRVFERFER